MLKFKCIREGVLFVLEEEVKSSASLHVYKKESRDSARFQDMVIYPKPDTQIKIIYLPA